MEPILLDGEWRAADAPSGVFTAFNPETSEPVGPTYPVSRFADVEVALAAAKACVGRLEQASPEQIADFLEAFALGIEARRDELVAAAHAETGLPKEPRLAAVELPRMTDQLRQAARAVRERHWVCPTIDTKHELRSMYVPLGGPVVVFGPNNFPFAFNAVAGGDLAAAIAARNPVLAKAHPSQPRTSQLLAETLLTALRGSELPLATVQMVYALTPEDGLALVRHPDVGAVAFTGGRASGLALKRAADEVGKPIYLELSSINPVFVLPGALAERGPAIADELAASCLLGVGQFCTNPGLCVVLASEAAERFLARVAAHFDERPRGTLLNAGVRASLHRGVTELLAAGAERVVGGEPTPGARCAFANTLLRVSGDAFLQRSKELQREAFGPVNLTVVARDLDQMTAIAAVLEGNLTATVYSHEHADDASYAAIEPLLRRKVGRLLNDRMPTGVVVSPAMVHGGPHPSTGHPGFTAVGMPASFRRFAALRAYDHVRADRLPPELKNTNPTGKLWRWVDGEFTQRDVEGVG